MGYAQVGLKWERALSITAFVISSATFAFNILWAPFAKRRAEQNKLAFDFKRQVCERLPEPPGHHLQVQRGA